MAEKKVLIKIDVDEGAALKAITESKKRVLELRDAQKELKASGEETSEEFAKNAVEMKSLNTVIRDNERILQNVEKANRANTGSIQEQRAQVAILKQQWAELTEEERENTQEGKDLSKSLRVATDDLKEMESSIGDNTRNVGNYKDALSAMPGVLGGVSGGIGKMTEQSIRFLATPIGAILGAIALALSAVSSWFNRSAEGQESFNKISKVTSAVVGTLLDYFGDLGEYLFNIGDNWDDLVGRFESGVTFLKHQFVDRLVSTFDLAKESVTKGILDMRIAWNEFTGDSEEASELRDRLSEVNAEIERNKQVLDDLNQEAVSAFNAAKDAVVEFFEEVSNDADAANQLAERQNALRRREMEFLVEQAELEVEISDTRLEAMDKANLTAEERLIAATKAQELTNEKFAQERAIVAERLALRQLENSINDSTLEDLEAEAQLRADLIRVDKARADAQRELLERVTSTQNEIRANAERAIREEREAQQERYEEAVKDFTDKAELELVQLKEKYAQQLISKEEYEQELQDVELASLLARRAIQEEFGMDVMAVNDQIADYQIQLNERVTESAMEQQEKRAKSLQSALGQAADLFEKHTAAYKILKIAQASIDTYTAANNALASAPPPYNFVLAGLTVTQGLVNVSKIASQKFEQGGTFEVGGKSHSSGGTKFVGEDGSAFEAERGELIAVVNKRSTSMLKALSAVNEMGGGVSFFGSPVSYAEQGGIISRSSGSSQDSKEFGMFMDNLQNELRNLQVITRISDINDTNSRINEVVDDESFL